MTVLYHHTFTVTPAQGYAIGNFPSDMLRYDTCYPKDTSSAVEITFHEAEDATPVHLAACQDARWTPTYKRWESFGWIVIRHMRGHKI